MFWFFLMLGEGKKKVRIGGSMLNRRYIGDKWAAPI